MHDPFAARHWCLGHDRQLTLGPFGLLMGIVNVTPDSFSDGGRLAGVQGAVEHALRLAGEGAAILDIGGESTRPGAAPVSEAEEQARILPVIEALRLHGGCVISVDTWRSSTARLAMEAGAHIINDVHGLQRDTDMAGVVAEMGAGLCIMHTGRNREVLPDVIADQAVFLERSLSIARDAGVSDTAIVLDPGFGFAKDTVQNLALMARFAELHRFGLPLLAGTSRKRFLGAVTGQDVDARDVATAATTALLRVAGAAIFRVHDVAINRDALRVADAMLDARHSSQMPAGQA